MGELKLNICQRVRSYARQHTNEPSHTHRTQNACLHAQMHLNTNTDRPKGKMEHFMLWVICVQQHCRPDMALCVCVCVCVCPGTPACPAARHHCELKPTSSFSLTSCDEGDEKEEDKRFHVLTHEGSDSSGMCVSSHPQCA